MERTRVQVIRGFSAVQWMGIEKDKMTMANVNYSGINQAGVAQNGTWLLPGRYLLRVLRIFGKDSVKSGTLWMVEFEILESSNSDRRVGSQAAYSIKMTGNPSCFPNIKAFLGPLYGIPLSNEDEINREVTEEFCNLITSGDGKTAAGKEVRCECSMKQTQKNTPFTLHAFSPA